MRLAQFHGWSARRNFVKLLRLHAVRRDGKRTALQAPPFRSNAFICNLLTAIAQSGLDSTITSADLEEKTMESFPRLS